jgi:addiction module HigA family antidote
MILSHPGKILKSGFIDEYEYATDLIARILGIEEQHLLKILEGIEPITHDLSLKLAALTGTPAKQWINMQELYDDQNTVT